MQFLSSVVMMQPADVEQVSAMMLKLAITCFVLTILYAINTLGVAKIERYGTIIRISEDPRGFRGMRTKAPEVTSSESFLPVQVPLVGGLRFEIEFWIDGKRHQSSLLLAREAAAGMSKNDPVMITYERSRLTRRIVPLRIRKFTETRKTDGKRGIRELA